MILVIDVGNTNIVFGVYEGEDLKEHWRIGTNRSGTVDEYGVLIHNLFQYAEVNVQDIKGIILSSVVPQLMYALESCCQKYFDLSPMIVGPGIKTGLNIKYENPRDVGADRIVNAVAAIKRYGPPLIIVDFGTATTFEYIDRDGNYVGGSIAPGIGISTEALYQHAAKLPRIEFEMVRPKSVIGRNPVTSMQSGIIYGYAGQVDGIVERIRQEFASDARVIATGGLAEMMSVASKTIETVNPLLTLQGLKIIYEMNGGTS